MRDRLTRVVRGFLAVAEVAVIWLGVMGAAWVLATRRFLRYR